MKIIHFISGGDVGGAKTHVLSLLHGLMQEHTVQLICFIEGEFAEDARRLGIPTEIVKSRNVLRDAAQLAERVRREGYDVIHCHGSRANMMGALLHRRVDVPVVTTVHSDYRLDYLGRPLHRLTFGTINTVALRFLDAYIGVSDAMAELLISRGFDPQRMYAIYNGVDFSDLTAPMGREEYFDSIGLQREPDSVVFGIAARISPVKDMGTLVRAFAGVVRQCPSARLVIAGDGEQAQEIQALAAQLCPAGTVCFAGWVSDTDSFYHAIDVNMLTSVTEGFPYALPEGARMHCAAIASRVGGIPALIDDQVNGFLFTPRDVPTLTDRMLRLAQDAALRQQMADALFEKTRTQFSVEATVNHQVEIYRQVCRRHARRQRKRDGVLICGAYGKRNAGDDAILRAIVMQMKDVDEDIPIYALSRRPRETRLHYRIGACHTFNIFKFLRIMRHTRLYISGGGTLIQNVTSGRSLTYYLSNIRWAHRTGNYVMMYGCGIGPVSGAWSRRRAARVIDRCVDMVTLRDQSSLDELKRMGVSRPEIRLTADPALLLQPCGEREARAVCLASGLQEGQRYVMFVPRPWAHFSRHAKEFAAAAEYAYEKHGLIPVLFALEPDTDQAAVEQVARDIHCPKVLIQAPENSSAILSLMQRMEAVVSMRLHALVFAAGQGVPLVGVVYDPKVSGFLDYMGQKNYVELDALTAQKLQAMLGTALAQSGAQDEDIARLRQLAQENEAIARNALEEPQ